MRARELTRAIVDAALRIHRTLDDFHGTKAEADERVNPRVVVRVYLPDGSTIEREAEEVWCDGESGRVLVHCPIAAPLAADVGAVHHVIDESDAPPFGDADPDPYRAELQR
jgi:hypothetical protein